MRENTRNVTNKRSPTVAIEVPKRFTSILQDQEQDLAHTAAAICRAGLYRAGCWGWRRAIACKSSSKEGCANPKTPTESWGEPAYVRAVRVSFFFAPQSAEGSNGMCFGRGARSPIDSFSERSVASLKFRRSDELRLFALFGSTPNYAGHTRGPTHGAADTPLWPKPGTLTAAQGTQAKHAEVDGSRGRAHATHPHIPHNRTGTHPHHDQQRCAPCIEQCTIRRPHQVQRRPPSSTARKPRAQKKRDDGTLKNAKSPPPKNPTRRPAILRAREPLRRRSARMARSARGNHAGAPRTAAAPLKRDAPPKLPAPQLCHRGGCPGDGRSQRRRARIAA